MRSTVVGAIGLVIALLVTAGAARAAWHQPVPTPLNADPAKSATVPSIASISGVPYVAWTESVASSNVPLRVARLSAGGTAWEPVGSPIGGNQLTNDDASITSVGGVGWIAIQHNEPVGLWVSVYRQNPAVAPGWEKVGSNLLGDALGEWGTDPSITSIAGVPYVAWSEREDPGDKDQIRVAHLNTAGTDWTRDTGQINASTSEDASLVSLAGVDGVPWVAWEETRGGQHDVHAAHLNSAGTQWLATPPVDKVADAEALSPSITSFNGAPWIAWTEQQGSSFQIRVARFEAGIWVRVPDTLSPINHDPNEVVQNPNLSVIGGALYVAWHETTAGHAVIHVARLNAAGTAWEPIVDATSPINQDPDQTGVNPSLADVGGVPYVTWLENAGAANIPQVRVSRLEPEFVSQSVTPGSTSATLSAIWHTYGVAFPLGFEYGASLESSTAPVPAASGPDSATITQDVSGLSPRTSYQFRAFAQPSLSSKLLAPNSTVFQTTAPGGGSGDTTAPETTITKEPKAKSSKTKARYKFKSSEPNSAFVCKFDKKKAKPCDAGKAKFKRLDDGKHKFRVYAVDAAGNQDQSPAKDKFKVL